MTYYKVRVVDASRPNGPVDWLYRSRYKGHYEIYSPSIEGWEPVEIRDIYRFFQTRTQGVVTEITRKICRKMIRQMRRQANRKKSKKSKRMTFKYFKVREKGFRTARGDLIYRTGSNGVYLLSSGRWIRTQITNLRAFWCNQGALIERIDPSQIKNRGKGQSKNTATIDPTPFFETIEL